MKAVPFILAIMTSMAISPLVETRIFDPYGSGGGDPDSVVRRQVG